MKGKQNVSSLHKIICNLVSLFLLYIMKVVTAYKFSLVVLMTSVLVSDQLISYLNENIKFKKLSTTYGDQQKRLDIFL